MPVKPALYSLRTQQCTEDQNGEPRVRSSWLPPLCLSRRSAACCHCGCVLGRKFSVSLSPAVLPNRLLRNLSLSAPCLVREVELRFYARISSIRHTPCTCLRWQILAPPHILHWLYVCMYVLYVCVYVVYVLYVCVCVCVCICVFVYMCTYQSVQRPSLALADAVQSFLYTCIVCMHAFMYV